MRFQIRFMDKPLYGNGWKEFLNTAIQWVTPQLCGVFSLKGLERSSSKTLNSGYKRLPSSGPSCPLNCIFLNQIGSF